jgi:hypothetical protein
MKLISELELKLFADEIGFQARRIATSNGQLYGRIPMASLRAIHPEQATHLGNDLAGCSRDTLKMFRNDAAMVECLL